MRACRTTDKLTPGPTSRRATAGRRGETVVTVTRRTANLVLLAAGIVIWSHGESVSGDDSPPAGTFTGSKAGDHRTVAGVALGWCPAGRFVMGSPCGEPERRPGEDQVEVTFSKGFWAGKYEVTQGQWRRVVGAFPGEYTAGEGDDFPVYDINFAAAEG